MEELSKRIDDVHKRFDDLRGDVNRRFDDVNRRFDDVDRRFDDVNRRIEELIAQTGQFRTEISTELRELRADMRAHFRWTVTTMVALFGVTVPVWMWFLSLILKFR